MTIAVGSRSSVALVTEVTYGTTPATPAFVAIPFTTFNINKTVDRFEDPSIQADRMQRYSIAGNTHITGDLDVSFSPTNFDSLLESVCNSSFTTNVLKVGDTVKSFTIENALNDVGQFFSYTGCQVDKLAINIPASGIVTAKFSIIGKDMAVGTSSLDADGYTAPTATQPYTHLGGTFKEGGTTIGVVTSLALTLDNGSAQNFVLGSSTVRAVTSNWFKVTGTVTVDLEDAALITKFLSGTASSIEFTLASGAKSINFKVPNVTYTGATKQIGSQGPITITLPFVGLYDGTSTSNVVITRVP